MNQIKRQNTPSLEASSFEDCVVIEQIDAHTGRVERIQISMNQINDLRAAFNLPEGTYMIEKPMS